MYKIKYTFSNSVHDTENVNLYTYDKNVGVQRANYVGNDDDDDNDNDDENYYC